MCGLYSKMITFIKKHALSPGDKNHDMDSIGRMKV